MVQSRVSKVLLNLLPGRAAWSAKIAILPVVRLLQWNRTLFSWDCSYS